MPPLAQVRILGLRELNRAFRQVDRSMHAELRTRLKEAAEPVRARAEALAFGEISNIGGRWGRMKTGVTSSLIYVAPATRPSGGSSRSNFGALLMTRAMLPAVEEKMEEVTHELEEWIGGLSRRAGF